jgi:hypothetical protein
VGLLPPVSLRHGRRRVRAWDREGRGVRLRVLRRPNGSDRLPASEPGPDVLDLRAHLVGGGGRIQERASIRVAHEAGAGDGTRRVEREGDVLELCDQRLQLGSSRAKFAGRSGPQRIADGGGVQTAPLDRRLLERVLANLGNHIRIGFSREAVDDLPTTPRCDHPPERDDEAADEQWNRKVTHRLRRQERQADGERRQAEFTPLFTAKVAKS